MDGSWLPYRPSYLLFHSGRLPACLSWRPARLTRSQELERRRQAPQARPAVRPTKIYTVRDKKRYRLFPAFRTNVAHTRGFITTRKQFT